MCTQRKFKLEMIVQQARQDRNRKDNNRARKWKKNLEKYIYPVRNRNSQEE